MTEPGGVPAPPTAAEQLVAREVATLRAKAATDTVAKLQADLLEAVPTELAAAFLRELALRALAGFGTREAWLVTAHLQLLAQKEDRAARRRGGHLSADRLAGT